MKFASILTLRFAHLQRARVVDEVCLLQGSTKTSFLFSPFPFTFLEEGKGSELTFICYALPVCDGLAFMKINLFEETKEVWDRFIIENDGSFLQSFEWGEVQESLSKKVWRFEVREKDQVLSQVQIIKETFSFGKSLFYIPFGPCFKRSVFLKTKKEILQLILKELKKRASEEKGIFLKIEPLIALPKELGGVPSLKRFQPQKTLILNLKKTEQEIFQGFHQKTRYNIRLAEKKGIEIIKTYNLQSEAKNYLDDFYKLIQKTASRDKFTPYPKNYYQKIFEKTGAYLFLAKYKKKVIAANLVIFFGKQAIYLHGASNYKYRKLMAPHLLQWVQIKEAKNKGCESYDFWGIDEEKWPGLTRFKKGFGGEEIEYPRGEDFVFSNFWYNFYRVVRKLSHPLS